MKKILCVMAVSAFILIANTAFAGGPGKKADGCPAACQQQIDDFNSSQAQQNEQLGGHGKQLKNHEGRISTLEKNAYDPWYARVGLRAGWMNQEVKYTDSSGNHKEAWDNDLGWGGALAFGRQFNAFRAELEVAYGKADLDEKRFPVNTWSGEGSVLTVMTNGYYEIPVVDAFSLYGMAGLGVAKYDGEVRRNGVIRDSGSDNAFAYKAGAGVTYNFTDNLAGDLGYEYLGIADTDLADSINSHQIVASCRIKF